MADVHEIADGIFRIATFIPEANITFNQFLIADENPLPPPLRVFQRLYEVTQPEFPPECAPPNNERIRSLANTSADSSDTRRRRLWCRNCATADARCVLPSPTPPYRNSGL